MGRFKIYIFSITILIISILSCSKEDKENIRLNTDPQVMNFTSDSGSQKLNIYCNTDWTITISSDWCIPSRTEGTGNDTIIIKILANTDTDERSVALYILTEEKETTIFINQKGFKSDSLVIPEGFQFDIPPDHSEMRNIPSLNLVSEMKVGWNPGNSLEAIGGETAWGNPRVSKRLIDSVKAAGFNAVRIPVAWSKFSADTGFIIQENWKNRVEEVVNFVLDNDMYAIINIHWDEGWIQPTYEKEAYVNNRLSVMWKQIATHFRDYDDHLLFAGTNEIMKEGDYNRPTKEYYTVQNGFNQTFVTTVRSTGGKNAYRHLVVQGFNTNIDYTYDYAVIPGDIIENRIIMEVHYYDPYNFTINEDPNNTFTQWGGYASDPEKTESWADESHVNEQFEKMKTKFIDKDIPVIMGEYGAMRRTNINDHDNYRIYYTSYVTQAMVKVGIIPFLWDNGYTGNHGFGVFNRSTGAQVDRNVIQAVINSVK